MSSIPELETSRLRLRQFRLSDSDTVTRLAGAAEVAATTGAVPHPYPPGAAQVWITRHEAAAEAGTAFTWAIKRKEDSELLGCVTLRVHQQRQRGELAYWLGVPYWNQGFMTEATSAATAFGFRQLGLYRIEATMLPRNIGSSRVVEKLSFQLEGRLRGWILKNGVFEDVLVYGLLRPEFEERSHATRRRGQQ